MTLSTRLYLIPVLSKALQIIEFLQTDSRPQSLDSIHAHTQFSRSTVYRILKTLSHHGYVVQGEDGHYRVELRPRKLRFGFANMSDQHPVARVVESSLRMAAASAGIDLVVLNNMYDGGRAVANAEEFVRQRVQLVIEFQVDEKVAPVVADKIWHAGIPLIALGVPHPHAVFYGVDGFRAGWEAGKSLAEYAKSAWDGTVSWVLGLTVSKAGSQVQSRITGAFAGIKSKLPKIGEENFLILDDDGRRERSHRLVRDFLRRHPKEQGVLIASVSDTSALGAVGAIRELRRVKDVAVVGQDGIEEAIGEIRKRGIPLIGTVAHHFDKCGPDLIRLSLALFNGESVPPYNYFQNDLVTHKKPSRRLRR